MGTPNRMTSANSKTVKLSAVGYLNAVGEEDLRKHTLTTTYDTVGIPMYANLLKLQGQAETSKHDFEYGGWTRNRDKVSRTTTDPIGPLNQIIPDMDASISYVKSKQKLAENALKKAVKQHTDDLRSIGSANFT